ncbi:SET domain-containing protein-lysine N-methyltransferase [Saprospiraceae bacterium]|nr:SET domain-containing protein-lysine N-methyltransferase [Saprospiraceae bacterium]
MLTTQSIPLYIVQDDNKGRSVYAGSDITKGSIIEICPIIILSNDDTLQIHKTLLHDYYFLWEEKKSTSAIALGYGSLYNHSNTPNADFELVYGDNEIHFLAIQDIVAGTEICIDYMSGKVGQSELWFDVS